MWKYRCELHAYSRRIRAFYVHVNLYIIFFTIKTTRGKQSAISGRCHVSRTACQLPRCANRQRIWCIFKAKIIALGVTFWGLLGENRTCCKTKAEKGKERIRVHAACFVVVLPRSHNATRESEFNVELDILPLRGLHRSLAHDSQSALK